MYLCASQREEMACCDLLLVEENSAWANEARALTNDGVDTEWMSTSGNCYFSHGLHETSNEANFDRRMSAHFSDERERRKFLLLQRTFREEFGGYRSTLGSCIFSNKCIFVLTHSKFQMLVSLHIIACAEYTRRTKRRKHTYMSQPPMYMFYKASKSVCLASLLAPRTRAHDSSDALADAQRTDEITADGIACCFESCHK